MKWEEMTPADFDAFLAEGNDVCVVPVGSMEKHGKHLPVGNDTLKGYMMCVAAAERVPCVVMPPFYITHVPGACIAKGALNMNIPDLLRYFEHVCDEIGRNGFRKIVLVSAHGGNGVWLPGLVKDLHGKNKSYVAFTYYTPLVGRKEDEALFADRRDMGGHGGASETAIAMHLYGHLVREEKRVAHAPAYESARPYDASPAEGTYDWISSVPGVYNGSPAAATAEIGKVLVDHGIEDLAAVLKKIHETDTAMLMEMKDRFEAAYQEPVDTAD